MATPTSDTIARLIAFGYPESVARRIASGELDMSPNAIAQRREAYPDQLYHGSMQDIQGEFTAGYGDGLLFFTPDPQFASNWVGKGKMQQRAGELDWHDRFKPQRQAVYDQLGRPEYGTPEYDEFERLTKPIRDQEMNAFKTVYPVRTRLLNTFDPTAEGAYENVVKPIFEKRFGGSIDPETERYLRQGSYMFYEDRDVVRELKKLGYDSMRLSEDSDGNLTTIAKFDPYDIKSLGAAFDPEYVGPNILGNADPKLLGTLAGGSLLGAVASKAKSEESQAKEVDPFVQALMDYTSDARFVPSAQERLIPMSEIPAEMKPMGPDLIRDITNYAGNLMGGDYWDYRAAEGLMNVADFAPYVGGAISLQQGADAYRNNRKWEGRMLTGLGLLEAVPLFGKMASESIKPIIRPTIRNWDRMGSPWDASDGLLRYLERQ